jgi:hypothetical protein
MKRSHVVAAILLAAPVCVRAQDAITADSSAWWRETARKDLAAARQIMDTRLIVALNNPGPLLRRRHPRHGSDPPVDHGHGHETVGAVDPQRLRFVVVLAVPTFCRNRGSNKCLRLVGGFAGRV